MNLTVFKTLLPWAYISKIYQTSYFYKQKASGTIRAIFLNSYNKHIFISSKFPFPPIKRRQIKLITLCVLTEHQKELEKLATQKKKKISHSLMLGERLTTWMKKGMNEGTNTRKKRVGVFWAWGSPGDPLLSLSMAPASGSLLLLPQTYTIRAPITSIQLIIPSFLFLNLYQGKGWFKKIAHANLHLLSCDHFPSTWIRKNSLQCTEVVFLCP